MRFDIITIFPKIFDSYFSESIIKRAQEKGKVKIKIWNLRDFTKEKHKKVDDRPFGGGAGMVLMAEPILDAVQKIKLEKNTKVVILSAKGKQFNQKMAYDWSKKYKNFIFVTGRYEGIDERVAKTLKARLFGGQAEEISIGPYIITDGDVAVMAIVSALTRLVPDVINWSSLEEESFLRKNISKEAKTGWLEYPHYTRPEVLKYKGANYCVPKVLLSGHHIKIKKWREKKSKKFKF